MAKQVSFESENLSSWAEQYAQKASEVVNAAAQISNVAERVAGILLAPSDGWPHWAHAGASSMPGHPPAQQLALVYALSQRLAVDSVLHSRLWLAQEILCAAQENPGIQTLGSLQRRVVQGISSELGADAASCRAEQTIFAITAARCRYSSKLCLRCMKLCCQHDVIQRL